MKKLSIILFTAVLAFAFSATTALAGPRHGYAYNGSGIIVEGNFPVKHVGFFSNFPLPPPPFFPFVSPKIHRRVNRNQYGCDGSYGYHRPYRDHHNSYRKHQKQHRRDSRDDYNDKKSNRSHRNRRNF